MGSAAAWADGGPPTTTTGSGVATAIGPPTAAGSGDGGSANGSAAQRSANIATIASSLLPSRVRERLARTRTHDGKAASRCTRFGQAIRQRGEDPARTAG